MEASKKLFQRLFNFACRFFLFPALSAAFAVTLLFLLAPVSTSWAVNCSAPGTNGTPCDDGNVCTLDEFCLFGSCGNGSAAPNGTACDDGDDCSLPDACLNGSCNGSTAPDGTPCDDGDVCTLNDACLDEECIGSGQLDCSATSPDGDPCHEVGCRPLEGCVNDAPKLDMACNHILIFAGGGFPQFGGGLFLVDRDTGYRTPVTNFLGRTFVVEASGSILTIRSDNKVYRIDPVTKTPTEVSTLTCPGVQPAHMALESPNSLIFNNGSGPLLYRLNIDTGLCTLLDNVSIGPERTGSGLGGVAVEAPGSYLVVASGGDTLNGRPSDPGILFRMSCDPDPANPPNCVRTVVSDFACGPISSYCATDQGPTGIDPFGLALVNSTTAVVNDQNGDVPNNGVSFEGTVSLVDLTSGVRTTIAAWSEFPFGALPYGLTFADPLGFIWASTDQSSAYCDPDVSYSGCSVFTCPRTDPLDQCTYTFSGELDKIDAVTFQRTLVTDLGDPNKGYGSGDGLDVAVYCDQSPAACDAQSCDDVNPCTDDGCNPGTCCIHTPNNDPCDDGDDCTTGDICQSGSCTGGTPVTCSPLDQCHVAGTCTNGVCDNPIATNGSACDDGDPCTTGDSCQSGNCTAGTPVTCSASDQCHDAGTCNPGTGTCDNPAKPDGFACSDANACTQSDSCQAGACTGANPVVCTASDQCHDAGTCNPSTGTCDDPPKADGSTCNDSNSCTQTDTCQTGSCTGSNPVTCSPSDQCHDAGTCNPGTGTCDDPAKADGSGCDDANSCTTSDACSAGSCVGGAGPNCDDGNVCTDDSCAPATGCSYTNNSAACDDGNPCTGDDACSAGACQGGSSAFCPDEVFELDGDFLPNASLPDWTDIFNASGNPKVPLPNDFGPANFKIDSMQPDTTVFAGSGNSDNNDISTWSCTSNNPPQRHNLRNAYATVYVDPTSGHKVLYFAASRVGGGGPTDAFLGLWYLQEEDEFVSCTGSGTFSGQHNVGDLLILANFAANGQVSLINVYKWNPSWNPADPSDNLEPIAEADNTIIPTISGAFCDPANIVCTASNEDPLPPPPWDPNPLNQATFFEGGIDLDAAGLQGNCYSNFLTETRGSVSTTATLHDYATGSLPSCDATPVCGNGVIETGETCDDGNTLNGDCCSASCQVDADGSTCNDGDACTQSDTCQLGACSGSNPVICSASDQCHDVGTCDTGTGQCSNPAKADGSSCDDSNACTEVDSCQSGACVGGAAPAEICDGNDNDCDGQVDEGPAWANKGQACTSGVGACQANGVFVCDSLNPSGPTVCNATPGTPAANDASCDGIDDDCNGATDEDYMVDSSCFLPGDCAAGNVASSCVGGVEDVCNTGTPTTELCDNNDNDCDGQIDNDDPGAGASCDTGLLGVCAEGTTACLSGAVECEQSNQPSTEICDTLDNDCDGAVDEADSGGGLHQPPSSTLCAVCGDAVCEVGETCPDDCGATVCGDARCDENEDCADDCGNACGAAVCGDAICTSPEEDMLSCPDDCMGMSCGDARCDEGEACPDDCGSCGPVAVCGNGTLETGEDCDDGNTVDGDCCDATCQVEADGNLCEDGDACTTGDSCLGGDCTPGSGLSCDDGNFCNGSETCDPDSGCEPGTPPSCPDDGLFCNGTESCNEATDSCASGTPPCPDDGLFCNGTVSCNEGTDSCVPGVAPCSNDGNVCNGTEACDEAANSCIPGTPLNCGDGNVCNGTETCNPTLGCQAGTPLVCGDSNQCTDDTCNPLSGCVFTPDNTNNCNDGNACSAVDSCSGGVCVGGAVVNCDDGNPNTVDSCVNHGKCKNTCMVPKKKGICPLP